MLSRRVTFPNRMTLSNSIQTLQVREPWNMVFYCIHILRGGSCNWLWTSAGNGIWSSLGRFLTSLFNMNCKSYVRSYENVRKLLVFMLCLTKLFSSSVGRHRHPMLAMQKEHPPTPADFEKLVISFCMTQTQLCTDGRTLHTFLISPGCVSRLLKVWKEMQETCSLLPQFGSTGLQISNSKLFDSQS